MKASPIERMKINVRSAIVRAIVAFGAMAAVTVTVTVTVAGCALQPVQPWEKGDLAKPAMGFSMDPLDDRFTQHIYNSKENASGGYGAGGGGCGCN